MVVLQITHTVQDCSLSRIKRRQQGWAAVPGKLPSPQFLMWISPRSCWFQCSSISTSSTSLCPSTSRFPLPTCYAEFQPDSFSAPLLQSPIINTVPQNKTPNTISALFRTTVGVFLQKKSYWPSTIPATQLAAGNGHKNKKDVTLGQTTGLGGSVPFLLQLPAFRGLENLYMEVAALLLCFILTDKPIPYEFCLSLIWT